MATNYDENELVKDVNERDAAALKEYETGMQNAINTSDAGYNSAINSLGVDANGNVKEGSATDRLMDSQNAMTEFAIDEIERQKAQAKKDYTKEQSGAYKDWQTAKDPYGANAEKMAANGMTNTGYAESSQVAMYNQYQSRVTAARESYNQIIADYNAGITQARLQNNATLAQIVTDAMNKRMELVISQLTNKTNLLTTLAQGKATMKQQSTTNYLNVLQQVIAKEQADASLALEREKFAWQKEQANKSSSGGSGSGTIKKSHQTSSGGLKAEIKDGDGSGGIKETAKNETKEPTVDMKSVLALGYGPVSASKLNSLVESGQVAEYEENGKLKYSLVIGGRRTKTGTKGYASKSTTKNK